MLLPPGWLGLQSSPPALPLSLHFHGCCWVPDTLTFCMDHGYSFLTALSAKFLAPPHSHPTSSKAKQPDHSVRARSFLESTLTLTSHRAFLIESQFNSSAWPVRIHPHVPAVQSKEAFAGAAPSGCAHSFSLLFNQSPLGTCRVCPGLPQHTEEADGNKVQTLSLGNPCWWERQIHEQVICNGMN